MVLTNDNDDSRRVVEQCYKHHKTVVNPIIEWKEKDVWDFIKTNWLPYCELYNEGFTRLGCIGCPMSRTKGREQAFLRWSKYKDSYLRAFQKMLDVRKQKGKPFRINGSFNSEVTAKDVFNWWMEYDVLPGQLNWFEDFEEGDDE